MVRSEEVVQEGNYDWKGGRLEVKTIDNEIEWVRDLAIRKRMSELEIG